MKSSCPDCRCRLDEIWGELEKPCWGPAPAIAPSSGLEAGSSLGVLIPRGEGLGFLLRLFPRLRRRLSSPGLLDSSSAGAGAGAGDAWALLLINSSRVRASAPFPPRGPLSVLALAAGLPPCSCCCFCWGATGSVTSSAVRVVRDACCELLLWRRGISECMGAALAGDWGEMILVCLRRYDDGVSFTRFLLEPTGFQAARQTTTFNAFGWIVS